MNIDIENLHVVPHYDLAKHDTDKNCWCKPVMDDWDAYFNLPFQSTIPGAP